MLNSLMQFKYYFAKSGSLASLTYCLEGLKEKKQNKLQRNSKSLCKIFSATCSVLCYNSNFMVEGCTCPSTPVFLLCFSSYFTPCKSHRKGRVCVYLDASSQKKTPICKISTFGRNLPLTDWFTSHHFYSTAIHCHICCHFHYQQ